ncbi:unnamed protein product [Durusdinium trenchii]|uniref:Uncharacterized protein n=1 Tax=Durusdinium trenchii TaxID=1381693 RepID=A0ABP0ILN9_9DINO
MTLYECYRLRHPWKTACHLPTLKRSLSATRWSRRSPHLTSERCWSSAIVAGTNALEGVEGHARWSPLARSRGACWRDCSSQRLERRRDAGAQFAVSSWLPSSKRMRQFLEGLGAESAGAGEFGTTICGTGWEEDIVSHRDVSYL